MASWTCPFCEAEMTVKQQLVGQVRPCAKCGQESTVTDAADPAPTPIPPRQSRPAAARPQVSASTAVTLGNVETETLTSVVLAQCLLVVILVGSVCSFLFGLFNDEGGSQVAFGLMGIVSVVISWPIYSIANESYRSRKLLEELLKNSRL